jgi:hypothetical protein
MAKPVCRVEAREGEPLEDGKEITISRLPLMGKAREWARADAEWLCHRLSRFQRGGNRFYAGCGDYEKSVSIVERPLPDESEVMGEAVAVNCAAKTG